VSDDKKKKDNIILFPLNKIKNKDKTGKQINEKRYIKKLLMNKQENLLKVMLMRLPINC